MRKKNENEQKKIKTKTIIEKKINRNKKNIEQKNRMK